MKVLLYPHLSDNAAFVLEEQCSDILNGLTSFVFQRYFFASRKSLEQQQECNSTYLREGSNNT